MEKLKLPRVVLMEKAWKAAMAKPEGIRFEFATASGAIRARMAMYNAVKQAKQGLGMDMELIEAATNVEICWDGKLAFIMRPVSDADFIKGVENALGEKMSEQVDPVLEAMERELQRRAEPQEQKPADVAPLVGNFGKFGSMR